MSGRKLLDPTAYLHHLSKGPGGSTRFAKAVKSAGPAHHYAVHNRQEGEAVMSVTVSTINYLVVTLYQKYFQSAQYKYCCRLGSAKQTSQQ